MEGARYNAPPPFLIKTKYFISSKYQYVYSVKIRKKAQFFLNTKNENRKYVKNVIYRSPKNKNQDQNDDLKRFLLVISD
jgi:hypothetical protein